jgi:hypothetical protein
MNWLDASAKSSPYHKPPSQKKFITNMHSVASSVLMNDLTTDSAFTEELLLTKVDMVFGRRDLILLFCLYGIRLLVDT